MTRWPTTVAGQSFTTTGDDWGRGDDHRRGWRGVEHGGLRVQVRSNKDRQTGLGSCRQSENRPQDTATELRDYMEDLPQFHFPIRLFAYAVKILRRPNQQLSPRRTNRSQRIFIQRIPSKKLKLVPFFEDVSGSVLSQDVNFSVS